MDKPTLILVFSKASDIDTVKTSMTFDIVIDGEPCKRNMGQYVQSYQCKKSEKAADCTHPEDRFCDNCNVGKKLQLYESFKLGDPRKRPEAHIYFVKACKVTKDTLIEMRKWDPNSIIVMPTTLLQKWTANNVIRTDDPKEYTRQIITFIGFDLIRKTIQQAAEIDISTQISRAM